MHLTVQRERPSRIDLWSRIPFLIASAAIAVRWVPAYNMQMRSMVRLLCIFCSLVAAVPAVASDKKSADQPAANLHFIVVKDANNKPVRAASVVLHTVNKDGTQAKGGLQLKTDGEGNAGIDGIPYGPLRIQVLAPGFQTYGDDYQVNKPEMEFEFRLKRPGDQLSIYDKDKDKSKSQAPEAQPAAPPATPPSDPKPN